MDRGGGGGDKKGGSKFVVTSLAIATSSLCCDLRPLIHKLTFYHLYFSIKLI